MTKLEGRPSRLVHVLNVYGAGLLALASLATADGNAPTSAANDKRTYGILFIRPLPRRDRYEYTGARHTPLRNLLLRPTGILVCLAPGRRSTTRGRGPACASTRVPCLDPLESRVKPERTVATWIVGIQQ